MPLGSVPLSARVSTLLGFESPEQRTAASYERELAAHKATESELREALARDQALLRQKDASIRQQKTLTEECHHRLLNNLQMIVALLVLQSRKEANAETASRLSIAADRVRAIAGLHHHLHSMDGTPTVEFKPYLDRLCRDHSTMSMSEERPDQVIAVDAIELSLPTTIGIPLSLIVNELITNAIKHGSGRITVTLAQSGKGHALSVSNGGSAPAGRLRSHRLQRPGNDPGLLPCRADRRRTADRSRRRRRLHEIHRAVRLISPWSSRTLLRSLPSGPPRTPSPPGGPEGEQSTDRTGRPRRSMQ